MKEVDVYYFTEMQRGLQTDGLLYNQKGESAKDEDAFVKKEDFDKLLAAYQIATATIRRVSDRRLTTLKSSSEETLRRAGKYFGPFAKEMEFRIGICLRGLYQCDSVTSGKQPYEVIPDE